MMSCPAALKIRNACASALASQKAKRTDDRCKPWSRVSNDNRIDKRVTQIEMTKTHVDDF